ncbi:MAG: hypothetical protein N3B13_12540, partial [Deltaproteobacteria bacterium]|nr:hypothetical protein [Deltaproteobacteria bacterium]
MQKFMFIFIAVVFLTLFVIACSSEDMVTVNEYDNHKRIIFGKISRRLSIDDKEVNSFLTTNEIIKINCSSCLYRAERVRIDRLRNVFKLQQYYKGYKVFGHTVVLHTDSEFNPVYVIDHSFPLDSGLSLPEKIISVDEAESILKKQIRSNNVRLQPFELGIVTYTERPLLRYRVKAFLPERPFDGGTFDIDAVSGEILKYEPALVSTSVMITNTNNENVEVQIAKYPDEYSESDCADNYCAVDITRGETNLFGTRFIKTYYEIEPAQYPGEIPPSSMLFSSGEATVWDGAMPDGVMTRRIEGISAHYSAQRIYDWYAA